MSETSCRASGPLRALRSRGAAWAMVAVGLLTLAPGEAAAAFLRDGYSGGYRIGYGGMRGPGPGGYRGRPVGRPVWGQRVYGPRVEGPRSPRYHGPWPRGDGPWTERWRPREPGSLGRYPHARSERIWSEGDWDGPAWDDRPVRPRPRPVPTRRWVDEPVSIEESPRAPRRPIPVDHAPPRVAAAKPVRLAAEPADPRPSRSPPASSARVVAALANPPPSGPPAAAAPPSAPPARPGPIRPEPPAPRPVAAPVDTTYVPGEVLCEAKPGAPADTADAIARDYGYTRLSVQPLALAGGAVVRYRVGERSTVPDAVRALQSDVRVAAAQPNHLFRLQEGKPDSKAEARATGGLADAQYAIDKLRLREAHRVATGEGVTVAVIDSGVDGNHPELAGALAANVNTLGTEAKPEPHGTGIAGIIAAHNLLEGVAPRARLVALRAFAGGPGGAQGTTSDLLRALDLAAGAGARVVNMSFSGSQDPILSRAIAAGHARGMVFVAAAGNGGPSAAPAYPASDPKVIAVTATDATDGLYASANRGEYIGVAAPGVDVIVAAPGGGYGFSSGTSFAAAHVSGIVALMLQREPGLTPDAVRRRLAETARDLGPVGPDPSFGAGLVDARAPLGATVATAAGARRP